MKTVICNLSGLKRRGKGRTGISVGVHCCTVFWQFFVDFPFRAGLTPLQIHFKSICVYIYIRLSQLRNGMIFKYFCNCCCTKDIARSLCQFKEQLRWLSNFRRIFISLFLFLYKNLNWNTTIVVAWVLAVSSRQFLEKYRKLFKGFCLIGYIVDTKQ